MPGRRPLIDERVERIDQTPPIRSELFGELRKADRLGRQQLREHAVEMPAADRLARVVCTVARRDGTEELVRAHADRDLGLRFRQGVGTLEQSLRGALHVFRLERVRPRLRRHEVLSRPAWRSCAADSYVVATGATTSAYSAAAPDVAPAIAGGTNSRMASRCRYIPSFGCVPRRVKSRPMRSRRRSLNANRPIGDANVRSSPSSDANTRCCDRSSSSERSGATRIPVVTASFRSAGPILPAVATPSTSVVMATPAAAVVAPPAAHRADRGRPVLRERRTTLAQKRRGGDGCFGRVEFVAGACVRSRRPLRSSERRPLPIVPREDVSP